MACVAFCRHPTSYYLGISKLVPLYSQHVSGNRCYSAASGSAGVALSDAQRARVLPPAFWRDFEIRCAEAASRPPRCTDRPARQLVEALLTPTEKATLIASPCRDAEAQLAATHAAFLDRVFLDAIGRRMRQIVLIGSGLDSRAYRLDIPPQLKVVELDQSEVHEVKAAVFEAAGIRARCALRHAHAGADFHEGFGNCVETLSAVLDTKKSSLFVMDGELLATWHPSARSEAFEDLRTLAANGSRLVVQVLPLGTAEASAEALAAAIKEELQMSGWQRMDIVGKKALELSFPGAAPPDEAGLLVVAEVGPASAPGRPPAAPSE